MQVRGVRAVQRGLTYGEFRARQHPIWNRFDAARGGSDALFDAVTMGLRCSNPTLVPCGFAARRALVALLEQTSGLDVVAGRRVKPPST